MPNVISVSQPEKLFYINDIVHDCKFDKEIIIFDSETFTLKIPFYSEEKKLILIVAHVERYQIHESSDEGPGSDDYFNVITYNNLKKEVWIQTIIAKGIYLQVKKLEISVDEY